MKRIAVLTSGGCAPGLAPAIAGLCYELKNQPVETLGILDGYLGILQDEPNFVNLSQIMTDEEIERNINNPGTPIFSSRENPYSTDGERQRALDNLNKLALGGIWSKNATRGKSSWIFKIRKGELTCHSLTNAIFFCRH